MVMRGVMNGMNNTIPQPKTETGNNVSSSARAKALFSEHSTPMPSLFGETSSMPVLTSEPESHKRELTVPSSETTTRKNIFQASLSDRLTESLISAGLVKGIIPTSMRKRSDQGTLDIAFFAPVGAGAVEQKAD